MGTHGRGAGRHDDLRGGAGLKKSAAEKLAALDAVVDALAHPARRQMLMTLHFRGTATAGEIAARFAHKWPTTTRHLRILENAGLIRFERQGRCRLYRVDREQLGLLAEWLGWFNLDAAAASGGIRRSLLVGGQGRR